MRILSGVFLVIAAVLAAPVDIAQAHVVDAGQGGVLAGFGHPFGGFDHLLAAVAVGLLAWRLGGAATRVLPILFASIVALAALATVSSGLAAAVEVGLAISAIALGVALAFPPAGLRRIPLLAVASAVAVAAAFHGAAHGLATPGGGVTVAYLAGLVAATLVLHLGGLTLARWVPATAADVSWKAVGATVAAAPLLVWAA